MCPQFDTLWDDLTIREHLCFYARLKGIPEASVRAAVQQTAQKVRNRLYRSHVAPYGLLPLLWFMLLCALLLQVDLDGDSFNMLATSLSGGMKRRLSLAIALIGSPQIVFLDEPTTGMWSWGGGPCFFSDLRCLLCLAGLDPETRRQIWNIIQSEKAMGRCMVVTTHRCAFVLGVPRWHFFILVCFWCSMEEADVLCTRIGIMCKGSLRCVGSQQRLKNRFGDGYKLNVGLQSEAMYPTAAAFVTESLCPGAREVYRVGINVSYVLPREGLEVATLFQRMEEHKAEMGIREFGLTQTSLEEVPTVYLCCLSICSCGSDCVVVRRRYLSKWSKQQRSRKSDRPTKKFNQT